MGVAAPRMEASAPCSPRTLRSLPSSSFYLLCSSPLISIGRRCRDEKGGFRACVCAASDVTDVVIDRHSSRVDFKDFFNQLPIAPEDLWKHGIAYLSEPGDFDGPPSVSTAAGDALVFVVELRMGFGIHPNSIIAQDFS